MSDISAVRNWRAIRYIEQQAQKNIPIDRYTLLALLRGGKC
jgi:hypothetical protein